MKEPLYLCNKQRPQRPDRNGIVADRSEPSKSSQHLLTCVFNGNFHRGPYNIGFETALDLSCPTNTPNRAGQVLKPGLQRLANNNNEPHPLFMPDYRYSYQPRF